MAFAGVNLLGSREKPEVRRWESPSNLRTTLHLCLPEDCVVAEWHFVVEGQRAERSMIPGPAWAGHTVFRSHMVQRWRSFGLAPMRVCLAFGLEIMYLALRAGSQGSSCCLLVVREEWGRRE